MYPVSGEAFLSMDYVLLAFASHMHARIMMRHVAQFSDMVRNQKMPKLREACDDNQRPLLGTEHTAMSYHSRPYQPTGTAICLHTIVLVMLVAGFSMVMKTMAFLEMTPSNYLHNLL